MIKRLENKGFTLIELLIVIVIIGILATAVLSAINPIEQINKAQDQGRKSNAAEIVNALERYYTTFEQYPWPSAAESLTGLGTEPPLESTVSAAAIQTAAGVNAPWLGARADTSATPSLIGTQEIKPDFADRKDLQDLKVYRYGNQANLVRVCFTPESNNSLQQAQFLNGELNTSACPGKDPATTGCQICVPE